MTWWLYSAVSEHGRIVNQMQLELLARDHGRTCPAFIAFGPQAEEYAKQRLNLLRRLLPSATPFASAATPVTESKGAIYDAR